MGNERDWENSVCVQQQRCVSKEHCEQHIAKNRRGSQGEVRLKGSEQLTRQSHMHEGLYLHVIREHGDSSPNQGKGINENDSMRRNQWEGINRLTWRTPPVLPNRPLQAKERHWMTSRASVTTNRDRQTARERTRKWGSARDSFTDNGLYDGTRDCLWHYEWWKLACGSV